MLDSNKMNLNCVICKTKLKLLTIAFYTLDKSKMDENKFIKAFFLCMHFKLVKNYKQKL